jgi:hypothetical protein
MVFHLSAQNMNGFYLAKSSYGGYTRNKGEKHPLFSRTIIKEIYEPSSTYLSTRSFIATATIDRRADDACSTVRAILSMDPTD